MSVKGDSRTAAFALAHSPFADPAFPAPLSYSGACFLKYALVRWTRWDGKIHGQGVNGQEEGTQRAQNASEPSARMCCAGAAQATHV